MKKTVFFLFLTCSIVAPSNAQIIIDHHCTDLSKIPSYWIDQAKSNLRISYQHTSHGSQPIRGMYTLSQLYPSMNFDWTGSDYYTYNSVDPGGYIAGVFLNDFGMLDMYGDLGHLGDLTSMYQTHDLLETSGCDRNVVIWSWCGGASDNDVAGINAYLNAMDSLEQAYPSITFVYMTGHLDGTGTAGNLHQMNELIRAYCNSNNKILFDFADIESYDPDGLINYNAMMATDGCQYDSTGSGDPWTGPYWTTNWINNNPTDSLSIEAAACGECMHSEHLNCILKGRAFWWMLARIAGWNGQVGLDDAPKDETPLLVQYDPGNRTLRLRFTQEEDQLVRINLFSITGQEVQYYERNLLAGTIDLILNAASLHNGTFIVKIGSRTSRFAVVR
jgi:hypothetical protein